MPDQQPNQGPPPVAELRAVRAYHRYIDEVTRFWKRGADAWREMRFWSIDQGGRVSRIPAEPLDVGHRDIAIDTTIFAAAAWIRRHRPPAVVLAAEAWGQTYPPGGYERLRRELGSTPDLSDPANRELIRTRYGATITESLFVYGELRDAPPPAPPAATWRTFEIRGDQLRPRRTVDESPVREAKFAGILDGTPAVLAWGARG